MSPQQLNPNERGGYARLTLAHERDPNQHLELDGRVLLTGQHLMLSVQGYGIVGHVEFDEWGWYLDTNEVAIMLHTGLWARLPHERGRVS